VAGEPDNRFSSNAQLSFLVATLLAVLGFVQLCFKRWFKRDTSRFLFWVFLLFGIGLALDHWAFALATRFWTLTMQRQSEQAHRAYEVSRKLAPYFLKSTTAVGVLNMGLALLRKRAW
jgi:hypothetical protein